MLNRLRDLLAYTAMCFPLVHASFAQDASMCGDAPRVEDERLRAELDGKANFLSSFLGAAALTGKIEAERRDIFSKTPEGLTARADAYLQYQVCVLLFSDQHLSTTQKIDELIRVRQTFSIKNP